MDPASPVNHGAVRRRFYLYVHEHVVHFYWDIPRIVNCKSNYELTIFVRFPSFFFHLATCSKLQSLFFPSNSVFWFQTPCAIDYGTQTHPETSQKCRAKDDFSQSMHCASILSAATLLRQGDRSSVTGVDVEIFVMQPLGPNKVNLDELSIFFMKSLRMFWILMIC